MRQAVVDLLDPEGKTGKSKKVVAALANEFLAELPIKGVLTSSSLKQLNETAAKQLMDFFVKDWNIRKFPGEICP